MDVKSTIDRVRSKLTDEQISEVGSDLESIKSGYLEKVDEWKAVTAESMERKRKIRSDKEELENVTIERDTWRTKFEAHDDSELIKERDKYKTKWDGYINTQKESFDNFLNVAKESDVWNKVSSEYKIPEEGKELSSIDIENNVEKMNYHTKLGLFDGPTVKPTAPTDKKSFVFSEEKVPTTAEYNEIRKQYGPDSYEARKAMELIRNRK